MLTFLYTSAFSRLTKVGIEKRGKKRSSFFGYVKVKTMLYSVVVMASVDYLDVDGSIPAVVTYFAHGHQTIYMIQ